jgi:hypothetical protein
MKNGDKPINPLLDLNKDKSGLWGLTKREYFAGLAMQGFISRHNAPDEKLAEWSINMADELLKQLEQ